MALMVFASLLALAGVVSTGPIYSVPVTYVALPSIPENIYNHVQDTKSGEYAFGYAGGPVAREEAKTADGVIRGAYSYVDAHGIVQHYRYVADDAGFRVAGTNIPTDAASVATPVLLEQPALEVLQSDAIVTETAAVADKSPESQSRKKRSIGYGQVPVAVEAVPAPLAIASVPTAASSQSRLQIHSSHKTVPVETIATVHAAPVAVSTIREAIPVAIAESVPVATSSQSRFQIHEGLKTEIPVAVPAVPIEAKTIEVVPEAVPVAVSASVPVATSSQSRYQVHKSSKVEFNASPVVEAVAAVHPVAPAVAAVALEPKAIAAPIAVEAAAPIAVAASLPVATSSQSRYQVHKSSKVEFNASPVVEAVAAVHPVAPAVAEVALEPKAIAAIPAAAPIAVEAASPIAVAASLPTSTSSQSRYQIHNSLKTEIQQTVPVAVEPLRAAEPLVAAIPVASQTISESAPIAVAAAPLAATATSNQRHFQVHRSSQLELNAVHQPLDYGVLDVRPSVGLQYANSVDSPLISRSPIGVGLGVVPSPVAAFYGPALVAQP